MAHGPLRAKTWSTICRELLCFQENPSVVNFRVSFLGGRVHNRFCSTKPKTIIKQEKKPNISAKKNSKKETWDSKELKLNEMQKKSILDELNSRSLDQLTSTKYVGKHKAEALIKHREDHGLLTSLDELSSVKGFGKAFYRRLESAGELPPATQKFSRQLEVLNNLLPQDLQQCISSIVSIDIGLQNAAWVHMDRECRVMAWQQVHITRPKPYNPAILKPQIQKFVDSLPTADAHIVEMQSHRVGKHAAALLPFVIHLRIVESMLHCLLPPPCLSFDPHYTSKYFSLPTGHAQKKKAAISLVESLFLEKKVKNIEDECETYLKEQSRLEGSKDIVQSLVQFSEDSKESSHFSEKLMEDASQSGTVSNKGMDYKLQISPELIEYFESCKKKDDLSDSLLQALAFYHLLAENLKLKGLVQERG